MNAAGTSTPDVDSTSRGSSPAARSTTSPRVRARRIRVLQYAVLLALVLVVAFVANWGLIGSTFLQGPLITQTLRNGLWDALKNTIVYTLGAFVLGLVGGTLLALMRLSSVRVYRWIASVWIEFFRGLPALIVLIAFSLISLAFPGLVIPFDPYGSVWLALGIVASAYMAETIRAGIQAVPRGQVEAARSLGMSQGMATRKIVLPQAFRVVLPPLTNELILLVKDSSLAYVIGLSQGAYELTKFGRDMANDNANLTPLTVCAASYLIITLPLTFVVRRLEARTARTR